MISKKNLKIKLSKEYNLNSYSKLNILHIAAISNKVNMLQYVLKNGIDINKIDKDGNTALIFGSKYGHLDVVKLLLKEDANQSIKNNDGMTALMLAKTEDIQQLLRKKTLKSKSKGLKKVVVIKKLSRKMRGGNGMTPLMIAATKTNLEEIKKLIEDGNVNIDDQDDKGMTALMHAISSEICFDCIEYLINKGANRTIKNNNGKTALDIAIEGRHKLTKFLLTMYDKPNEEITNGLTPLMFAINNEFKDSAKILITEYNVDVKNKDLYDRTALHHACSKDNRFLDIVQLLIDEGADVNAEDNAVDTPLHYVSLNGNLDVVKLLIDKGANVNAENSVKTIPLHYASTNGYLDVVKLLIHKGANINAKNSHGNIPLHEASESGHLDIVKLLIYKGANINAKNNSNNTPLILAGKNNHKETVKFLIEKGAELYYGKNTNKLIIDNNEPINNIVNKYLRQTVVVRNYSSLQYVHI